MSRLDVAAVTRNILLDLLLTVRRTDLRNREPSSARDCRGADDDSQGWALDIQRSRSAGTKTHRSPDPKPVRFSSTLVFSSLSASSWLRRRRLLLAAFFKSRFFKIFSTLRTIARLTTTKQAKIRPDWGKGRIERSKYNSEKKTISFK